MRSIILSTQKCLNPHTYFEFENVKPFILLIEHVFLFAK